MRSVLWAVVLLSVVAPGAAAHHALPPIYHGWLACDAPLVRGGEETCVYGQDALSEFTFNVTRSGPVTVALSWNASTLSHLSLRTAAHGVAAERTFYDKRTGTREITIGVPHLEPGDTIRMNVDGNASSATRGPGPYRQEFNITVTPWPPAETPSVEGSGRASFWTRQSITGPAADLEPSQVLFAVATAFVVALAGLHQRIRRYAGLLAALFSRHTKDTVLNNERRQAIHDFVAQHPGVRAKEVQRALGLANGPFAYHLAVLLRHRLLVSEKRFGSVHLAPPNVERDLRHAANTERLLEAVRRDPGLSQAELAKLLGVPRKTLHYHATLLRRKGLITVEQDGRVSRCYPARSD